MIFSINTIGRGKTSQMTRCEIPSTPDTLHSAVGHTPKNQHGFVADAFGPETRTSCNLLQAMGAVISLRSQNPSWLSVLSSCLRLDPREPESHGTLLQEVSSTAPSTSGPFRSQEERAEPPNQGKSPPHIQDRICRLRQAFGKGWRISLTIQIAKNVVRTTIG